MDDNDASLQMLEQKLGEWGVTCTTTRDVASALQLDWAADDGGQDVVVLDAPDPGTEPAELVARLRASNNGHRLPVVVLWSTQDERHAGEEAGADALVAKPVRGGRLFAAITEALLPDQAHEPRDSAKAAEPAGPLRAPPATRKGPARHVLLAEDNKINQMVTTRMLEKQGFKVDVAANGNIALEMNGLRRYAAIFMDCHMPVLDGYETAIEIRRRESSGCHTPIIALTASTMEGDRDKCVDAGMDDYLAKPVSAQALSAAIARTVEPVAG